MKTINGSLLGVTLAAFAQASAAAPPLQKPEDFGTAVAAQVACASIFVTGRDEAAVLKEDVQAFAPFTRAVTLSVDRHQATVTASAPATQSRIALFRPEVGCTLLNGDTPLGTLRKQAARLGKIRGIGTSRPWPLGDAGAETTGADIDRARLDEAVRLAFDEQNQDGNPDTRAVIVVQDGRIVAERYAPGFNRDSRLLGWSASKSVMGTLVGLLIEDGRLALDAPPPIDEWGGPQDPRRAISLRHLMTMSSGLAFTETYEPGDDATTMLFSALAIADYAVNRPLEHPPGTYWQYSSGTTNILSRLVFDKSGGTLKHAIRFARERLFEPLGMTSAIMEADEAGVPIGSSYIYATARDWARFGLLYLNEGRIGTRQLLSKQWIDFVRTPAPGTPRTVYGGQFWLNRGPAAEKGRLFKDLPEDCYMALGHNYQIVAIIPSTRTVIVRLGWTPEDREFDVNKHFARILAALGPAK